MEKQLKMKKILLLSFIFVCFYGKAQTPKDSVVMTIAGKDIPIAEFEYIARKNNGVNFSDEKSVKEYVELFKNFKLKVAEAEALGLDKKNNFLRELEGYKSQLKEGYMADKKAEEAAAKVIYDRGNEYLVLSQIVFPLPEKSLPSDTLPVYEQAMQVYNRIMKGEDFGTVGAELHHAYLHHSHNHHHHHHAEGEACEHDHDDDCIHATFETIPCFLPMERSKVLEETAYAMKVGEISLPLRTPEGFVIVKLENRKPFPGLVRIAHILIQFENDSVTRTKDDAEKLAEQVYKKASEGADLLSLIETFSLNGMGNGLLPFFMPGELIKPIEEAAYSLTEVGDVSKPFLTENGYHVLQLKEKRDRTPFEREKARLISAMIKNDRNFELYKGFDERLKKEYNFTFYPEAYAELEKLCEECFPGSNEFFTKARPMEKTLVRINGVDFPQVEFAYYMNSYGFSAKTYAGDFMKEVFDLFVRDIVTTLEKENLEKKYPEIPYLVQEYRDGMLLFEISNDKIWNKSIEEQEALEQAWIKDLNKKYPVSVNWKVLKKIKNN